MLFIHTRLDPHVMTGDWSNETLMEAKLNASYVLTFEQS
jgi:hypothetical protein